ncbi:hypothetical protein OG864_29720 [Streptomyces sp. NBC_00124]|uniref:hypothetical protein n=1 Tax=Streptomyces sp. NBC_00124 TaxID=2975662 RepID=UPI00225A48EA|nr:hypothetical protein [Streptomyces sp. NBC_00124]MCX5362880.1 hypothetical protein [Streptomyces sp. NBC_00124]
MGRVYATSEDYVRFTGQTAPAGIERLLARASEDVDSALLTALYCTDAGGMPTEADVIDALRDAVCAQVEYQQETGDTGTGAAGRWDSVSLGPVALSGRKDTASGPEALDLAPRAHRALRRAGLLEVIE